MTMENRHYCRFSWKFRTSRIYNIDSWLFQIEHHYPTTEFLFFYSSVFLYFSDVSSSFLILKTLFRVSNIFEIAEEKVSKLEECKASIPMHISVIQFIWERWLSLINDCFDVQRKWYLQNDKTQCFRITFSLLKRWNLPSIAKEFLKCVQ